ncbi:putative protein phosphatase 2C 21 [Lathyrus oleraceus]|uniref:Uncharacterized protein n=1 Tax=Pisum sativum TaxID=3888 RepID=A0A9D4VL12_PEA|nr:putative protein phosphatase 2C 21 [Pisum sativum]
MDEMMRGQRGWRELAVLGDKMEKLSGMLEGFIWSPRSSEANDRVDEWDIEELSIGVDMSCIIENVCAILASLKGPLK